MDVSSKLPVEEKEPVKTLLTGRNSAGSGLQLEPTIANVSRTGLLDEIETLHPDRLYDWPKTRNQLAAFGFDDLNIPRRNRPGEAKNGKPKPLRLGLRWIVESTNSWLTNFGQLRRNTDRHTHHRHAQLCLAVAIIITIKLIDWRNRWSPESPPIR